VVPPVTCSPCLIGLARDTADTAKWSVASQKRETLTILNNIGLPNNAIYREGKETSIVNQIVRFYDWMLDDDSA
jgi:hypothetical protein